MTRIAIVIAAAFAFTATLPALPAPAQARARVFVASYGSDSNPCTFLSPCRNFQQAVNVVDPGGEVTAIDSAGFGPINIMKAVTITSPNGVEAGIAVPSGGTAVTISAGPNDAVSLRGLSIDGGGQGSTGIAFTSGGSLNVRDSIIQNLSFDGIDFVPSAASVLLVSNTLVTDSNPGIVVTPNGTGAVSGVLDHVTVAHNANNGLFVISSSAQTTNLTVSESVISETVSVSGVGGNGVFVVTSGSAIVNVMVRNSTIANNYNTGLVTSGNGSTIRVTRSTITGNFDGWDDSEHGVILSYGDNNIDGNTGINSDRVPPCVNGTSPCTAYK